MGLDPNHKFEYGKYKGLTVEDVLSLDSDYIDWCQENAPNLLKPKRAPVKAAKQVVKNEDGKYPVPPDIEKETGLKENYNFLNERTDSDKTK